MPDQPQPYRPNSVTGRLRALPIDTDGLLLDYPDQASFNGILVRLRRKEGLTFRCKRENGKTRVWRTA